MLEEYDDGHAMEWSCVYGSRTSWRVQESGLHATRAGLWRAPVKSGNDPYVDWCGSALDEVKSAWYPMWEPPTARGRAASDPATRWLEGKSGECRTLGSLAKSIITWAIQCQWRGSQQYYMLVKTFSVQALETVKSSPEGVNAEVWRKQARNYEPDIGIRYDVILRSLLKRRSGEHDERDLGCEINTLGAKRLSSSVERSIPRQQWSS